MSKINTNMAGVTTLYHLRNKEEGMNKALERISSGLRLNHAVDDAAGASIVNRMTSQIKGLEAAIRNAADAISLTQTAEGAIEEVTQILHRMRELSVQSANGVYTGQDRQAIQNEVGALQEELHRIAESSTFNGVKMLNGSFLDTTFQVGFQPNDTATLSIEDVKPTGLGEYILKTSVTNAENYLEDETSPTVAGTETDHIASKATRVTLSLAEASTVAIHTIDQTVNSNDIVGVASDSLKAFVEADTGSTGVFSIEAADGQTGTTIDSSNFQIHSTTGKVSLATGVSSLDFEANASNAGNNAYQFKVVYTNSDGVMFKENVTINLGNILNETGASAVSVFTNTADDTAAAQLSIDLLSTDVLLQAKELGMAVNEDGSLDNTNFTGRFNVTSGLPAGVTVEQSTGTLTINNANDASPKIATTPTPNPITMELRDADNEIVYTETITLTVTDASTIDASTDGYEKSPPGAVSSRANTTDVDITTNTASGTASRLIEESDLVPSGVTIASLGITSDTDFALSADVTGVTLSDNNNGTFDLSIATTGTPKLSTTTPQTISVEARNNGSDSVSAGNNAGASATTGSSSATVISGKENVGPFVIDQDDLMNKSGSTAYSNLVSSSYNREVVVKGPGGTAAPSWVSVQNNAATADAAGTFHVREVTSTALNTAIGTVAAGDKFKFGDGTLEIEVEVPTGVSTWTIANLATALNAAAEPNTYTFAEVGGKLQATDETFGDESGNAFTIQEDTGSGYSTLASTTADITVGAVPDGLNFTIEIDKDDTGGIPVGAQQLEIQYVDKVTATAEVFTIDMTGSASASVAIGDVIRFVDGTNTIDSANLTAATDADAATKLGAAIALNSDYASASVSGNIITVTRAATGVFDETNVAVTNNTNAGNVNSSVNVTTQGAVAGDVVRFTETLNITSTPYVQHTFNVDLTVADGSGQGQTTSGLETTSKTENDNTISANGVSAGTTAIAGTNPYTAGSELTVQTNAPAGTPAFSFGINDITSLTSVIATADTSGDGLLSFELGTGAPDGVRLVDNGNGTFEVFIDVDTEGTYLSPTTEGTTFDIIINDDGTPGLFHTETITISEVIDLKGNVARTAVSEDKVGEVNIAMAAVEGAKVKVPATRHSTALSDFVDDNAGGFFALTGTDAERFRIDRETGEVTSRTFLDNENATDDGKNNTYDFNIVYTSGANSFTDKVALRVTNDSRDDIVTQAAGRPLVGRSAIDAASLVSEEEDFIIYGNVGTATIDVNGSSSAYELVQAINSRQGETGVYANAQTRVNISFPDQFDAVSDAVSFKLKGVNDEPVLVSGSVDFGVQGGRDANLRALADAINGMSGKTGVTAKVSNDGAMIHMFSNDGYDIVVEDFTLSVLNIPMNISATDDELNSIGDVQQLIKGTDATDTFRSTGEISFHSPYVFSIEASKTGINGGGLFQLTPGAADLVSVAELDVLTVGGAKKMLTAVDAALVRIDLERSDLGATMSRMEHTINNLSNIIVNTKAARSRIQDADIAEETTEMTKAQVLSQAAQAMLAQANRTSQSILSLLQG